jgi:hypothetical protein
MTSEYMNEELIPARASTAVISRGPGRRVSRRRLVSILPATPGTLRRNTRILAIVAAGANLVPEGRTSMPRALVVRGGWEGHAPVQATEPFIPHLEAHGYDVRIRGLGATDWELVAPNAGVGLLDFIRTPADRESRASGALGLHILDVMTSLLRSAKSVQRTTLTSTALRPDAVPLTSANVGRR